jgi:hypothetical protein
MIKFELERITCPLSNFHLNVQLLWYKPFSSFEKDVKRLRMGVYCTHQRYTLLAPCYCWRYGGKWTILFEITYLFANAINQILSSYPTTSIFLSPELFAKRLRLYDHLSPQTSVLSNDSIHPLSNNPDENPPIWYVNSPTTPWPEVGRDLFYGHVHLAHVRAPTGLREWRYRFF